MSAVSCSTVQIVFSRVASLALWVGGTVITVATFRKSLRAIPQGSLQMQMMGRLRRRSFFFFLSPSEILENFVPAVSTLTRTCKKLNRFSVKLK